MTDGIRPETEEERLIDRLRKVEALFARPGTEGERTAAGGALARIRERLAGIERTERPVEHKFTMADAWNTTLFLALLRRYGLRPYRYRGQRRNTVMVKVAPTFVNEVFWPEFDKLGRMLHEHLATVTKRVIAEAISGDVREAEERAPVAGVELPSEP
jgi:hypothetical protein